MKYFVASDVHGFYAEMKKALDEAGYDPHNPNHFFISCGDMFDRGNEPDQVLTFLTSLPKERRAFVQGNHESILIEFLKGIRSWSYMDVKIGTVDTILQLSGISCMYDFDRALQILSKDEELYEYIHSLVDYYETKTHIFVHGWIPKIEYQKATKLEWEEARNVCGFDCWNKKLVIKDKTIVCGHWYTSYAHAKFHHIGEELSEDGNDCHCEPFIDTGIIGLDANTALSHSVNVYMFEEGESKYV